MAAIYRVNMSDLSVRREDAPAALKELGGRALVSQSELAVPPKLVPAFLGNRSKLAGRACPNVH